MPLGMAPDDDNGGDDDIAQRVVVYFSVTRLQCIKCAFSIKASAPQVSGTCIHIGLMEHTGNQARIHYFHLVDSTLHLLHYFPLLLFAGCCSSKCLWSFQVWTGLANQISCIFYSSWTACSFCFLLFLYLWVFHWLLGFLVCLPWHIWKIFRTTSMLL